MEDTKKSPQVSILSELGCHLFPGKTPLHCSSLDINNQTYRHWREIWKKILELPADTSLPSDNFLRQDLVCAISRREHVVGMIAASFFNINQTAYGEHSYLKAFSLPYLGEQSRAPIVMSIEYLSVDPELRKNELGFSLGSVLLRLGMKIFEESSTELVLGTARSKIHVDEMCYKFGFRPLGEINKYGHPCTVIVNSKETLRRHEDFVIERSAGELWEKKTDYRIANRTRIAA